MTLSDAGEGAVQVAIDGAGQLAADCSLLFGIAAGGADYLVVLRPAGAALGKWNGATWAPFPHRALAPCARNGRLTFTLALADVGASSFDYWLAAVHRDNVEITPEWGRFTSLRS